MKLHEILVIAAMASSTGRVPEINSDYTQKRDRLSAERAKALAKKQLVREQIRARRAALLTKAQGGGGKK